MNGKFVLQLHILNGHWYKLAVCSESRCLFLQEGSRASPLLFPDFASLYVTRCKILAIFSCRDIILDELVI